jgi:DNA ligase-1
MSDVSPKIYKRDSHGKVRFWQFELDNEGSWRTISGIDGTANPTTTGWTLCVPKSQPDRRSQASFEANAEMQKKLARTYFADVTKIDEPIIFEPMLAQKFKAFEPGCYSQPKLDGIRCIATIKGLHTRQGKRIFGAPHIEEALEDFFANNPTVILDGELYNHKLHDDFNSITSAVRKQNPTDEDLAHSAEIIEYHVYDLPSEKNPFSHRSQVLKAMVEDINKSMIVFVETTKVRDAAHLDELYEGYLKNKYEGQMVRADELYEQKRSKYLRKRKEFMTAEFPISTISGGSGNWANYAKSVEFILPGDKRKDNGDRPDAGIKGDQAFTKKLLDDAVLYEDGKGYITLQFFRYSADGIPIFPVAIDFFIGERTT